MKRRDFLKILGALVVAPSAAIAAIKAGPEMEFGIPYWIGKPKRPWKKYSTDYLPTKSNIEKFRRTFKNTKFKRPLGYYKGCPIYYQSSLSDD